LADSYIQKEISMWFS